jgi:hypothetical protein
MTKDVTLDELWNSLPSSGRVFRSEDLTDIPEAARRYLEHAIAPGTQFASAVRLQMHGEIKLKDWLPFTAEQVISLRRGMIWKASVRLYGAPITGSDMLVDGEGAMKWKLFGLIPIVRASGPDTTRSTAGRLQAESVWLPSTFWENGVEWAIPDPSHANARFTVQGHEGELALTIADDGQLKSIKMSRWGNPEGAAFHKVDFGGIAEDEQTFGGYTIPTRLRIGWHFAEDRFESDGEFFRVTVDGAVFR